MRIHQDLIALRHQHPALRTGAYTTVYAEGMTYGFTRALEGERLLVMLNAGLESVTLPHAAMGLADGSVIPAFSYHGAMVEGDNLHLPPRSALVATIAS